MYQTDWSANAESSLHSYNRSHLITVYDPFNVLLNLVCWYSVEEFCIYIHQGYWLVIFFSCGFLVWFWYQGNAGLIKMSFEEFPSLLFWGKFQNNWYQLFFEYLVEFTSEASGPGCWNVLLVWMFLITDSISLLVISLHIFYFILIQSL